jgi:hypothetical protein
MLSGTVGRVWNDNNCKSPFSVNGHLILCAVFCMEISRWLIVLFCSVSAVKCKFGCMELKVRKDSLYVCVVRIKYEDTIDRAEIVYEHVFFVRCAKFKASIILRKSPIRCQKMENPLLICHFG